MFDHLTKQALFLGLSLMFAAEVGADAGQNSMRHSYTKPRPAPEERQQTRRRRHSTQPQQRSYSQPYSNDYRPGRVINPLPYGASRLNFGRNEYYYYEGYFYQPNQNGYMLIDAPVGAIVITLPRLHHRIKQRGVDYYVAGDTYYTRHQKGYRVADNPYRYRR
jgi:hypothetical protein